MEVYIPILIGLLFLSAFFSSAETAFLSIQRVQLEHAVREGVPGAHRVLDLLSAPGRLLSAILLGNNLVNTAAAAVGTVIATEIVAGGGGVLIATGAVTVLLVIFGEIGPKTAALNFSMGMSRVYSIPMRPWILLTRPIVIVLDALSRALLRLAGTTPEEQGSLTVGELRTAIMIGREAGAIEEDQSEMLLGALALRNIPVRRLMVSRVDIVAAEATESIRSAGERLASAGYQRLPVYGENMDDIVGFAHISDVTRALIRGQGDMAIASIVRPITFEPENASAAAVFERMQDSNTHMVILLDEYGSTSGLITLEDLLEEVVGEIRSESGAEAIAVEASPRARTVVDGRLRLSDLSDQLGVEIEHPVAETVAGLILEELQYIPRRGESISYEGYRFGVVAADNRRIKLVAVEREEARDDDENDNNQRDEEAR
jgi:putative hemolysin